MGGRGKPLVSYLLKSPESNTYLGALWDQADSILLPRKWAESKACERKDKAFDCGDSERSIDGSSWGQSALWFVLSSLSIYSLSLMQGLTHIHTNMHMFLHVYTHSHTTVHTYTSTHTHTGTQIDIHIQLTFTYVQTETHTYTYSHAHTRSPSLIHAHIPVKLFSLLKEKKSLLLLGIKKQYLLSHSNTLKCYPIYHSGLETSQLN